MTLRDVSETAVQQYTQMYEWPVPAEYSPVAVSDRAIKNIVIVRLHFVVDKLYFLLRFYIRFVDDTAH